MLLEFTAGVGERHLQRRRAGLVQTRVQKDLALAETPIGPDNDDHVRDAAETSDIVVCAWGNHADADRAAAVRQILRDVGADVYMLKLTKAGRPSHPVRLPADLKPTPY